MLKDRWLCSGHSHPHFEMKQWSERGEEKEAKFGGQLVEDEWWLGGAR